VTHVEEAEQVAAGPRRRFNWDVAIVAALVLGLAGVVLGMYELSLRAETAETTTVSLAEQVQGECDTNGELRVNGRDLCDLADEVVEDPGAELVPVNGRDGVDGTDGADGADGADGKDGIDGKDGKDGRPGKDGVDGNDGLDAADGLNGADGRGIQSMQCATGGWIIKYTDGLTEPDPGPCQGPQGVHGPQGPQGIQGEQGTAKPGDYTCPDGEVMTGLTIAEDGAVTLACEDTTPPIIDTP